MALPERSFLRGASKLIGFAFYVFISVAILLEMLLRTFSPQILNRDAPEIWAPDEELGWLRRPNIRTWTNTGERDVEICTDQVGDRVDCERAEPRTCKQRMLIVGDSMVEALSVPFEQTVWARLEQDTAACVLVMGVGGYNVGQYLASIQKRMKLDDEPIDVVILNFYASNDFVLDAERIPRPRQLRWQPFRLFPARLTEKHLHAWFYPYNAWLEQHSHTYVAVRFAIRRFRDPGDVGMFGVPGVLRLSQFTDTVLDETVRGVRLIAAEVKHAGASLLVTVIPHRLQVLDPHGEVLAKALPYLRGDIDMDLVSTQFVPRLKKIPEVDAVVDLLPFLREHADATAWGPYDRHPSPEGHRLWFEAVREPVRRLLRR